jgi:hypothetical protein
MTFIQNIKATYADERSDTDRGDIVQTILLIAGFAIVAILVVTWIGTAVLNKGADVAECIEGANTYNVDGSNTACQDANHAADNSFKNDSGYQGRYGSGG